MTQPLALPRQYATTARQAYPGGSIRLSKRRACATSVWERNELDVTRRVRLWPDHDAVPRRLPLPDDGSRTCVLSEVRSVGGKAHPSAIGQRAIRKVQRACRSRD